MTRGKKLYGGKKRKKDFSSVKNLKKRGIILKADRRYKDTVFRMLYKDKRRLLELYNTLIDTQSLYSSVMQKIPTPNFIVFYNGEQDVADRVEYRLSDAFEMRVADPALELKVTVLNINYGRNAALMEQCRTLRDYAAYVKMVRSYKEETGSLGDAVRLAIDECIKKGILSEFLRRNRAEVELTSIFEYNQEEEERKLRIAERRGGVQFGRAESLYKLVRNFSTRNNVTIEKACDMMGISPEEYLEAERVIKEDNR